VWHPVLSFWWVAGSIGLLGLVEYEQLAHNWLPNVSRCDEEDSRRRLTKPSTDTTIIRGSHGLNPDPRKHQQT
jgi:hypothetical protein